METIPRKIFILDDNASDREMCCRFLTRSIPEGTYLCLEHASLDGAWEAVRTVKPHCVLLDYFLRDGTGVDFLRQLHSGGLTPDFAIVMLTGAGSETRAAESIKSGAHEYVSKEGLSPQRLRGAVEEAIQAKRRMEEMQRQAELRLSGLLEENKRKDLLLSTLHHDLRTSLTPLMLTAGMLREHPESPASTKKLAEMIVKNAEFQSRVIDSILGTGMPRSYGN